MSRYDGADPCPWCGEGYGKEEETMQVYAGDEEPLVVFHIACWQEWGESARAHAEMYEWPE